MAFPPLERSAKRSFAFKVACPSYVYRAGYADNVRHLAPFVDEIELLFFESRFDDSLPPRSLIRELGRLARCGDITYNVHLPSDIDLGHRDKRVRQRAVAVLTRLIDRCASLDPSTYTLHLNHNPSDPKIQQWRTRAAASLEAVLAAGVPSRRISVENIDDDLEAAAALIQHLDLSVCLDMGHLMLHGLDVATVFDRWQERITMVHLHGVADGRDHLPLDRCPMAQRAAVTDRLNRFDGVISLEVFSVAALNASITHLLSQEWRLRRSAGSAAARLLNPGALESFGDD